MGFKISRHSKIIMSFNLPIGSIWIHKYTERLVILTDLDSILGSGVVRIRFVDTGVEIDEPVGMFTWNFVKLEDVEV
jgi:hypothetical protein